MNNDNAEVSTEEHTKLLRYMQALQDLVNEDIRWESNLIRFRKWDLNMCLWWIGIIEAQAETGLDTLGTRLVSRVVANRLT